MNKHDKPEKRGLLNQTQRLYLALLVLAASILASALVVIYNNSPRSSPVFIFLLFLGLGTMLALGMVRGVLVGLLMISAWIVLKHWLGVWGQTTLLYNLLELIIVGLTFTLCGIYHDRLQAILKIYKKSQSQLKRLDIEDKTIGLIKPSVGLLRLKEEEDRSVRYRRPFALILILVRPIPEIKWEPNEGPELMRAIATSIKDTTRETDIPFLAGDNKIAIILPETETSGANKVVNKIINRMTTTQSITPSGDSMFIQTRVQLRFGFAVFIGTSNTAISMMEAAERSLQSGMETHIDDLFQNIFIEWETVGEPPLSTPLFDEVAS